jgi:hypothetical protein
VREEDGEQENEDSDGTLGRSFEVVYLIWDGDFPFIYLAAMVPCFMDLIHNVSLSIPL